MKTVAFCLSFVALTLTLVGVLALGLLMLPGVVLASQNTPGTDGLGSDGYWHIYETGQSYTIGLAGPNLNVVTGALILTECLPNLQCRGGGLGVEDLGIWSDLLFFSREFDTSFGGDVYKYRLLSDTDTPCLNPDGSHCFQDEFSGLIIHSFDELFQSLHGFPPQARLETEEPTLYTPGCCGPGAGWQTVYAIHSDPPESAGGGPVVPEPATILLLGSGLAALRGIMWMRKRRK